MLNLLPTAWVRSKAKRWPLSLGDKSATRRSVNTGLTRHSAITKESFPRASNSSRRTSGCFVSRAMRSISDWSCSGVIGFCQVSSQRLRVAQIIFYLLFNLLGRHHLIERGLGRTIFLRPDAMAPVNVLDCPLIGYPFCKRQRLVPLDRGRRGEADNRT